MQQQFEQLEKHEPVLIQCRPSQVWSINKYCTSKISPSQRATTKTKILSHSLSQSDWDLRTSKHIRTHTHTCTYSLIHTLTHSFTPCLRTGQRAFKMLTKDPCLHTCMLSFCSDTLKWPRVSEGSFSIPLTLCLSRTHRLTALSLTTNSYSHAFLVWRRRGSWVIYCL